MEADSPALRFEVLGPLRAWRGADAVDLGPLQQRIVLAVLLLQGRQPIARQQMINAVWGGKPPTHAVNLVQRHVSGLRRVLRLGRPGRTGSCHLAWTDAGYLLAVPGGALDLDVFDAEVGRARAARGAGELAEAGEALHAALALWRGPVCDGLFSPYLDAQRDRLAESRISVAEECAELDLEVGGRADLIAELRELVASHPLRERLHGLLMLALHRAGRRADALAVFRDARRLLQEELGVEPAPPLQRLHQQILAGDPQLAGPAEVRVSGIADSGYRRPVPAQLPHSITDFTGRDAEIGILNGMVPGDGTGGSVVIAAITGTAGVGKSALAVHWAHRVRDRFPDGQLYVDLRGFGPAEAAMMPAEAIRGFLDAFAVPPDRIPVDLDAQGALYRSMLAELRVLIVLDNARDSAQVRSLLPGFSGCLVVVTSRNQLISLVATDGAHAVPLDLLPSAEARRLFTRRLCPDRVAAEPAAVDEIIDACAGLPLALSVVTARAAANSRLQFAGLAEELREHDGALDALDGGEQHTNVRAVFSWSYRALTAPAARLFRLLSLHAGPDIGVPAAASLAAEPRVRVLLAELTRAHLLIERGRGRFAFHDLLRAYAGELADARDSAADRRMAVHRVLDHYLHTAHRAEELLRASRDDAIALAPVVSGVIPQPLSDHRKALTWFDTEYPGLLAAMRQAAAEGFEVHTWQLAWALTSLFDRRAHWHDAATVQRVALDAANRLGDLRAQAVTRGCLAYAYIRLSRHQDAYVQLVEALDLYDKLGDRIGQAHAHRSLTWVFDRQGRHQEALPHAEQAVELFQAAGHQTGQARALNALGWFQIQLGDYENGLRDCQRALDLQRKVGDQFGQADTLDSIASAYHRLGRYDHAAAHFRQAVSLYRDFGDRYSEADAWSQLGDVYRAAGDPASATGAWQQALTKLEELSHPDAAQVRAKLRTLTGSS